MDKTQHTLILRASLTQEARVLLSAANYWRHVRVLLPESPKTFIALDVDPSVIAAGVAILKQPAPPKRSPDGLTLDQAGQAIGWDRNYKMPEMNGSQPIPFYLAPGQYITGMSSDGACTATLIVEWVPGPRGTRESAR